jgi:hypothetical protein
LGGILALHLAWRQKKRNWPLVGTGWALVLASILAWDQTSGADKGPALGIVSLVLLALLAVALVAWRTPVKLRRAAVSRTLRDEPQPNGKAGAISRTVAVITIVFAGLIVAISTSTAVFMANRAAGMEHTGNLTIAMFSFPLIWAALATFVGYSPSTVRKAAVLGGMALFSGIAILTSLQVV